jgi:hypothetical protein
MGFYILVQSTSRCAGSHGNLYYSIAPSEEFEPNQKVEFDIIADNQFHTYTIDQRNNKSWEGVISRIYFSPSDQPTDVLVQSIDFIYP